MSTDVQLWLVRHGETEWSRDGRHTGRSDLPLTSRGRDQAKRLSTPLARADFQQVWSSPLTRAEQTAILAGFGNRLHLDDDLCEWDYGEYEGRTTKSIRRDEPAFDIWTVAIARGESLQQVAARAERVIQRALTAGGCSLLFAHGHLLRILAARWLGLAPDGGRLLSLDAARISILGHEHHTRVIQVWNQAATPDDLLS
ncbi:MAG: histidine phosphatase family protein [Gammaproteobacteria bacterium]|jgi:broad specificity phosphatase PhoE